MKLSVNAQATIHNFNSVMSDKTKVISEVIQNARRSGADLISVTVKPTSNTDECDFSITDNGHGIADFEKLFIMSESGWNSTTTEDENAFGLGFFSTLFACSHIHIESNGKSMTVDCEMAKQMFDFGEPSESEHVTPGTSITLHNMKMSVDAVNAVVGKLSSLSRIPVKLNGVVLKRPGSLELMSKGALEVVNTPYGTLVLKKSRSVNIQIVVQDLFITDTENPFKGFSANKSSSKHFNLSENTLYSDSLKCRMPDRDELINSDEIKQEITAWFVNNRKEHLLAKLANSNEVEFLDEYYDEVLKFHPELLNELDYLPAEAFEEASYPEMSPDPCVAQTPKKGVHKSSDDVLIVYGLSDIEESPVFSNFLHFANAIVIVDTLPKGHWAYAKAVGYEDVEFEVHCEEGIEFPYSMKYQGGGNAIIAKKVTIKHVPTNRTVNVELNGFTPWIEQYVSHGQEYNFENYATIYLDQKKVECPKFILQACPSQLDYGMSPYKNVLLQKCSYKSEYDDYQSDDHNEDFETFTRQIKSVLGSNSETLLSEMLGYIPPALAAKLEGKSMMVEFKDGKAVFTQMAA